MSTLSRCKNPLIYAAVALIGLSVSSPVASAVPSPRPLSYTADGGLWFAAADGTDQTQIEIEGAIQGASSFSPDGARVAYGVSVRDEDGGSSYEIRTRAADGTDSRLVTRMDAWAGAPRFSPDGQTLLLTVRDPETEIQNVWLVNADGTNLRQVTFEAGNTGDASWSPDGQRIVYARASDHAIGFDLAILNVSTGVSTSLTDRPGLETGPRWLPDGNDIVFQETSTPSSSTNSLKLIAPDGSGERTLSGPATRYWGAEYTPAGDALLLSVATGNYGDLYRLDLTSGISTRLTNTPTRFEYGAVLQPRPADTTAPTITIASPVDNQTILRGARVLAQYTCADETGGSGLESCAGPIAAGVPLDTSTAGSYTFAVTARDRSGNASTKTARYTVSRTAATAQRITFPAITARDLTAPDFAPGATSNSGLAVSYTAAPASVCTIIDGRVHLVDAGTCAVTTSQLGDATRAAAPDVTRSFAIRKLTQTITFTAIAAKTTTSPDFDLAATASSGLPVAYDVSPSTVCSAVGGRIHITGAGSCTVTARQAGNATYAAARDISRTFTVGLTRQTITFAAIGAKPLSTPDFNPGATSSSGLPVALSATPAAICTIVAGRVHLVAWGNCTVTAAQAGNSTYAAAPSVSRSFRVM